MKSHGLDMIGNIKLEVVTTLPIWTSTDERRLVYATDTGLIYYGDGTGWKIVVGTDSTQTLTNKTITSSENTLTLDGSDIVAGSITDANINVSANIKGTKLLDNTIPDAKIMNGVNASKIGNLNVNNTELSLLNGITDLGNTGTFVTNANGNPTIDDDYFTVTNSHPESTWGSVGPTDSNALKEWESMDSVESGADYVIIKLYAQSSSVDDYKNQMRYISVHARKTGGNQGITTRNRMIYVNNVTNDNSGYTWAAGQSEVIVPVDDDLRFDLYWYTTFNYNRVVSCTLVGWGFNPS